MSEKIKVKEADFLNWYFSDQDDLLTFAKNTISELRANGYAEDSVQGLLDRSGYIPGFISVNPNDENEYDPSDIELISNRIPGHCHKCGEEYDNSMDNFCSVCLESK